MQAGTVPLLALAAGLIQMGAAAQPLTREEILQGAQERIDLLRKAEATVRVVDADGNPIRDARASVRQVRHAFLFGANIFGWEQWDEGLTQAYRDRFTALLNYATLPFYWWDYESEPGMPKHASREAVARWCAENAVTTKGHPLVWNYAAADWLPEDPAETARLSDARVTDCVTRFAGLIDRWDVVNEAADPFRFENRVTDAWRRLGRIPFAREPFRLARAANPDATLLINDYRTDQAYADVIAQLVDEEGERLYDVIGIQSHMHGRVWAPEFTWEVCERFAEFGAPLHFTETTIVSGTRDGETWGGSTPEGEAAQADAVAEFYTVLFSHPAVEAITWWDLSDRFAWMGAPAGLIREDMTPKPAYDRLMGLIKGEWWTAEDLKTDDRGEARFRGFFGDYEVTVETGARVVTAPLTVAREDANTVEVRM